MQTGPSSREGLVWVVLDPLLWRGVVKGRPDEWDSEVEDDSVDAKRLLVVDREFPSLL